MKFLKFFSNEDKKKFLKLKEEYEDKGEEIVNIVSKLYVKRKVALSLIQLVYMYVSSLNNCPRSILELTEEAYNYTKQFRQAIDWENEGNNIKIDQPTTSDSASTSAVIGGVAIGSAVATMGPSVAMAIATTFGIASTGAAISSIGGITAINSALSWLRAGAIVGAHGGIAAGSALLALAGPIGWSVAITTVLGAGISSYYKKEKFRELSEQIRTNLRILEPKVKKLNCMYHNTSDLIYKVSNIKSILNYKDFEDGDYPRNDLFQIVNQTITLAKSLNETVSMHN